MDESPCVLLVEDEADARDLLSEVVRLEGGTPIGCAATSGVDALLETHQPCLAILDIRLPGEHGVCLAWRLRKRFSRLPIIVFSGQLHCWDTDDIQDCGADCILEKPCELNTLRFSIRHFMEYGRDWHCGRCDLTESCAIRNRPATSAR